MPYSPNYCENQSATYQAFKKCDNPWCSDLLNVVHDCWRDSNKAYCAFRNIPQLLNINRAYQQEYRSKKWVSGIGAVVKVVDSHPCGWGSIPGKSCSFLIVSLSKSLSLFFMCSDQHVKYWMPQEFLWTNSLLLDYHVKQHTHTQKGRQLLLSGYK